MGEAEMTEEYWDLFFGRRAFSERITRRIIIIHNRLERQRENLQKKNYNEDDRYVPPFQKTLFECEKQKR
jgi:intergrase/recombinase